LGIQISSVRFPKNDSSSCEWFIVTTDFGGFRKVKHLLIIFSLYRFAFHTKTLIFTVFEMSNFVLTSICRRFWFSALIGKKVRLKPIECLSKFMVTLLQLINHVGNDFDVSKMEISALKTSLALPQTAKKIRRQRIRGITRRRSESNTRRACRIIGSNSTSRFCTIESHGNDSKTRKLSALWTETKRRWKAIFHLQTTDSKTTEKSIGLWLEMRNGYSTTTPRRKNTMLSPVNRCHRPQHQHHGRTFMIWRSCSDRTKRILFTMSCWNLTIPLWAIGIGYNWFVWAMHCEKNGRNTSKDMIKLFFFMTTLGLMSLKS